MRDLCLLYVINFKDECILDVICPLFYTNISTVQASYIGHCQLHQLYATFLLVLKSHGSLSNGGLSSTTFLIFHKWMKEMNRKNLLLKRYVELFQLKIQI